MKNKTSTNVLRFILAGAFCFSGWFFVVGVKAEIESDFSALQAQTEGRLQYQVDANTSRLVYLGAESGGLPLNKAPAAATDPVSVANEFLAEYGQYFGLDDPATELTPGRQTSDAQGMRHLRYNQEFRDIPVYGAQLTVHLRPDLAVASANGQAVPDLSVAITPTLSEGEAIERARNFWQEQGRVSDPEVKESKLFILDKTLLTNQPDETRYLVWRVELFRDRPAEHQTYFINAQDGSLVFQVTGIQTAVHRHIYDCSVGDWDCYMDLLWGGYTYGRSEGQPARGPQPVLGLSDTDNLYDYIGGIHSYYLAKFSRNGANNAGGMGDGSGTYPTAATTGLTFIDYYWEDFIYCPNAFFNGANSIHFCQQYATPDITGHEYAHAVDYFSITDGSGNPAGLTYSYESGALNENNSDVFGEAYEYYRNGSNDWLIGEDLPGGASRSMSNPASYTYNVGAGATPYPDRSYADGFYCGGADSGGVHINSSVPNHAAYLMAMGGTFNGCTVDAIGRAKEEAIFYRADTVYYNQSTDFNEAYLDLIASCRDLYGANSAECQSTQNALQAVEMNQGGRCGSTAHVAPACADASAPTINQLEPADGAEDVSKSANIVFKATDEGTGISTGTINVTINGAAAVSGGAAQNGFDLNLSADGASYWVTVDPDADFSIDETVQVTAQVADVKGYTASASWSFKVGLVRSPKIVAVSGPGEATKLQVYTTNGKALTGYIRTLFPSSYRGGAGVVAIDASGSGVKQQALVFARSGGGPQARVMGIRDNGTMVTLGQMFVFDKKNRSGLSMTVGDFDNDGYQDDAAACLTGNDAPIVRVYKDARGVDHWKKIGEFRAPFGSVGCNLGTFQYDNKADEILVGPNHGPAAPYVYIYSVGGTFKRKFAAYGAGVNNGVTPAGINDRIYTSPNNGTAQINAFDKFGRRRNFWWAYPKSVRGDFVITAGDIDSDGEPELVTSPYGSNAPQILAFESNGRRRPNPNFYAFSSRARNGVGVAVIDNWHGEN